MAKFKTNRQLLKKMVTDIDDIHCAFIVSQLLSQADKVLGDKEAVMKEMENSIVHPNLWIAHNEELVKYLEQRNNA